MMGMLDKNKKGAVSIIIGKLKGEHPEPEADDDFGGALDILMEERDIRKAQHFVQNMLVDVLQNKMPLEKFIVSKQLRDDYKNPDQIKFR